MKKILWIFVAVISLFFGLDALLNPIESGDFLWQLRSYLLYYTGVIAMALMGLVMVVSSRPIWAERIVNGMDQVYQLHKWAGIWAVLFGALHWLIKLSKPLIVALIGNANRAAKVPTMQIFSEYVSLAKSLGEWAIYAALVMLVLTLWKSFPYKFWRHLHRIMPVLFLMVVIHTVVLMPLSYWTQPIGICLLALLSWGSYAALLAMFNRIGHKHRYLAQVKQAQLGADQVLFLRAQVDARWPNHQPGQFAFLCFDKTEGGHPFTIASAPNPDGYIDFHIKALGDHTRHLAQTLKPRQFFQIEGPYGCFELSRVDQQCQQLWVAGGIGITPFLAWLDALVANPRPLQAQLHYCLHQAEHSHALAQLQQRIQQLPNIQLFVHDSAQNQRLHIENIHLSSDPEMCCELWFCGPSGLLNHLQTGLEQRLGDRLRVHSEAFIMR